MHDTKQPSSVILSVRTALTLYKILSNVPANPCIVLAVDTVKVVLPNLWERDRDGERDAKIER